MPDGAGRLAHIAHEADVAGFRQTARRLLAAGVDPGEVQWVVSSAAEGDLFATADSSGSPETAPSPVHVPAFFVPLCERAALHADPGRFGLLYRLLWRLVHAPDLRHDVLDADRLAAEKMARTVRRDMHKMTAFVRFRPLRGGGTGSSDRAADAVATGVPASPVASEAGAGDPAVGDLAGPASPWHVAWFEPENHIVEATAPFFARRFAQMRWAILTPARCVRWDGQTLAFGPGARRDEAPPADAGERLWLTYYEHIFNPARLKLKMMQKEMPRRYWPNLPEARLIHTLSASAAEQSVRMVDRGGSDAAHRRPRASMALRVEPAVASSGAPVSLAELARATQQCRACPIGALATQSVPGKGVTAARLMLVGEQPGDQEDLRGEPFVGPAGQLLENALRQLGWPRDALYVTNAVKHFKYELRGARRIHKTPAQREAAACLHWLESEIDLVGPEALIALGATAARSLMGRAIAVTTERGRWLTRDDGRPVLVTLHPSALLRMDPSLRSDAYDAWLRDLSQAASYLPDPTESGSPG